MKSVFFRIISLAIASIGLGSCDLYPDDPERISDLDMVLTYYDTEENFDLLKTYAIIDSVRQITDDTVSTPIADNPIAPENSKFVLDLIKANMESLGYTFVEDIDDADVALNVGAVTSQNIIIGPTYPGYWYGCGIYWCDPGYWYGYPGYGYYYPWIPVPIIAQYETGTLVMDIISLDFDPDGDPGIPIIWTGVLRGVLEGSEVNLRSRVRNGINQAFDQSPYL